MVSNVSAMDDVVISLAERAQKECLIPEDDDILQGWEVLNLTLAAAQQFAADAQKLASEDCPPDEVARVNDMAQEMLGRARDLSAALTSDKRGRKDRVKRAIGSCGALGISNFRNMEKSFVAAAHAVDSQEEANNQQFYADKVDSELDNNRDYYPTDNKNNNQNLSGGGMLRVALTSGTNLGKVASFAASNFVEDAKFAEHLAAMRKLSPQGSAGDAAGDFHSRRVDADTEGHTKKSAGHTAGEHETTKKSKTKVSIEKNASKVEKAAADVADDVAEAAGDVGKTATKTATKVAAKEMGFLAKAAKFGKKLIPFAGGAVTALAAEEAEANIEAALKAKEITADEAEKIRDFNKAKVVNDTINPFLVISVAGEQKVKENLEKQVSEKAAKLALNSTAEDLAELAGGSKAGTKHYKKLTDDKAKLKTMADDGDKLAAAKLKVLQVRESADHMGVLDSLRHGMSKIEEFNKAQDDFNAEAEKYEQEKIKEAGKKAKEALAEKKPADDKPKVEDVKDGETVKANIDKKASTEKNHDKKHQV